MKKLIKHEWSAWYPTIDIALRHLYEQVGCYQADGWDVQSTHTWDSHDAHGKDKRFSASANFSKVIDVDTVCR